MFIYNNQSEVIINSSLIESIWSSVGKDSRPGNGKAIELHSQIFQNSHILLILVIRVGGNVSVRVVLYVPYQDIKRKMHGVAV